SSIMNDCMPRTFTAPFSLTVAGKPEYEAPRFHQRVEDSLGENPTALRSYSTLVPFGDVTRPFSFRVNEVPGVEYSLSHLNGGSAEEPRNRSVGASMLVMRGWHPSYGMRMRDVSSATSHSSVDCSVV